MERDSRTTRRQAPYRRIVPAVQSLTLTFRALRKTRQVGDSGR